MIWSPSISAQSAKLLFEVITAVLSASTYELTKEIGAVADWTKQTIIDRQERLAALAARVWPR